ncbi:MAG TPA: ABC transporter substrate-binding protein [Candidatus Limihabitans stercoravium]|nr:ABC transporter substrate-binding protein [Candidatus Limihabitans stercoravium]
MKKFLALAMVVMLLAVGALAVGCQPASDNVIRVNEVTHSIFYAPQYVAMQMGYFEEEGLEIVLTNGGGADNVMTALLTGEADVGLMGCEASIYVYLQGKENYPRVFAQLTKRDGSFLVGRNVEENFDYSSLHGKHILMGRKGGMPAMILEYVLNQHGLTDGGNVTMDYSVQFNFLTQAFVGGTGDYVPLFEPNASLLEQQDNGYIVSAIGTESGEIPYTCYTATPEYLEENSEKMEKFLRAVWKGYQYILDTPLDQVAELLLPLFPDTDVEIVESSLDNYLNSDVWTDTPVVSREAFTLIQDIMENAGELSQRVDYETIIDTTIASKI